MKKIVLGALLALAMLLSMGQASFAFKKFDVGDSIWMNVYCTTEASARTFSKAIEAEGRTGFIATLRNKAVKCHDARHLPLSARVQGKLMKKVWTIVPADAKKLLLQFWMAKGPDGKMYYIYTLMAGKAEQPV